MMSAEPLAIPRGFALADLGLGGWPELPAGRGRPLAEEVPVQEGVAAPAATRNGATAAEQRTSAAEGRRDRRFDIYWNSDRYGFNGGRWARNQRPPEPVLAAIRERGVTIFGRALTP